MKNKEYEKWLDAYNLNNDIAGNELESAESLRCLSRFLCEPDNYIEMLNRRSLCILLENAAEELDSAARITKKFYEQPIAQRK
jgi:hypothetical protein